MATKTAVPSSSHTSMAPEGELVERAVALAAELAGEASGDRRRAERRRRARLAGVIDDPATTRFTVELTDAALRVGGARRAARLLDGLVRREGVPRGFAPLDRAALRVGAWLAPRLPAVVLPLVRARVRAESAGVVVPAEDPALARHIARRRAAGVDLNLNVLGEAILGEEEAARRVASVRAVLARPDVDYVSVKVSALASQLNPAAFDHDLDRVCDALRPLLADAASFTPHKFVNLDMEEFRDLELTIAAFTRLLDEPALSSLEAGIVLQAYLPDSHDALDHLHTWAAGRRARGGAGIKVRLVKGANLAMEQVEAELHGWRAAPYTSKAEVDASYKRLVDRCLQPEHVAAVRVGVASHNLFDVAWAITLAEARGVADRVEIEMLEGMAPPEARAVRRRAGRVLLYAPVTSRRDFTNAVAYLVRRLDENTAPGNFLREALRIKPGTPGWAAQADAFRRAVADREAVLVGTRRGHGPAAVFDSSAPFANEADSDLAVGAEREALLAGVERAARRPVETFPLVLGAGPDVPNSAVRMAGGEATVQAADGVLHDERPVADGIDPSTGAVAYRYELAQFAEVERAVATAVAATAAWSARPVCERAAVLDAVAAMMAAQRADTAGVIVRDGGKAITEADVEISEAIDFARYYGRSAVTLAEETAPTLVGAPVGPVVVSPPWNFPYAIPAGGVLAALAAGNAVILKPAPQAVWCSWALANQLWDGGVPRDVLQFLPCPDDDIGRRLVSHPDVGAVILTGARATADLFRSWKPDLHLLAETSGKNAIVVTAAADVEAAVRDLVRSAFGHAGQKCSAASLAIVEAAVYDSPDFRRQLRDAAASLRVGPAGDAATVVGPVIGAPSPELRRALTQLDPGESWLLEPREHPTIANLWSPGIRLGVAPGSFLHRTECFGPVLGVMRAPDLDTAIEWQNAVDFGLTGGIASLDVDEVETWCERVQVGNAYVNRGITGAVVQRQPFGGWKASAVGPGAKAGGPNYVAGLQRWTVADDAAWAPGAVAASAERAAAGLLGAGHDPSGLASELNVLRYRPLAGAVLVVVDDPSRRSRELATLRTMANAAGSHVEVVALDGTGEAFDRLASGRFAKVRSIGEPGEAFRRACADAAMPLDDTPVLPHGRLELLRWVREQAVSITNHRYGDLGTAPVPAFARAVAAARHTVTTDARAR